MSEKKEAISKRQARREEIRRKEQKQRLMVIGVIAVIALAIVGLLVIPSIRSASAPVGEFVKITPVAYSQVDRTGMGDPNAKVKIEIFEDYTCSACKVYSEIGRTAGDQRDRRCRSGLLRFLPVPLPG